MDNKMEKPQRKIYTSHETEEKRLTTAPIRERQKNGEIFKAAQTQLPAIRGKNFTREGKRPKKEEKQHEHEDQHKRPQTSKGSRGSKLMDSEYYEENEDDLIMTSKQQKIDMFKKLSRQPKH